MSGGSRSATAPGRCAACRSEEHTSELQSQSNLVCRLLLEKQTGFGMFYSVIEGNTIAFDEPQAPYGLSYPSHAPPLCARPLISAADGTQPVTPMSPICPPL